MTIDLRFARMMLNRPLIEDRVWRAIFGTAVSYRKRVVLRSLILVTATRHDGSLPPTKDFVETVKNAFEVKSLQTAENYVEETREAGLITTQKSKKDKRVVHYVLAEGVREKLEEVAEFDLRISRVVEAQLADMENRQAGFEIIQNPYIYTNLELDDE